jgi:S1-C subfamily serine protease
MTDNSSAGFSWVCPACDRRVPRKFTECRCGYKPNWSGAPPDVSADETRPPSSTASVASMAGGVVVTLTVIVVGAWTLNRPGSPAPVPVPDGLALAASSASPSAVRIPAPTPTPAPLTPAPLATPKPSEAPAPGTLEDLVARALPAVVRVETSTGSGSGFFVTADTLFTNVHVVTGNSSVTIRRSDGSTQSARVAAMAPDFDVALLRIASPAATQATIPLGSASGVRIGQEVVAIGSALGLLQNTVTRGIVSGIRQVGSATLVQTDAALNPGNSGGPLLDRAGNAIGVNSSGFRGAQGLNFAVSIDHARALLEGRVQTAAAVPLDNSLRSLSPAQPASLSDADVMREKGLKAYELTLERAARRADSLDEYWRRFRASCYRGNVGGSFDREWFALWDARAMQGTVAPGCESSFAEAQRVAAEISQVVLGAEEAARTAGVFPGVRRDARRKYHLDYAGWDR